MVSLLVKFVDLISQVAFFERYLVAVILTVLPGSHAILHDGLQFVLQVLNVGYHLAVVQLYLREGGNFILI